jgi:2-amino-4-hydroxy-6-hydroxymethyldihydropteridine diphosphokinase
MQTAIILLGSNLGNRARNLETAIEKLAETSGRIIRKSSVYESPPWGMESDRDFYNQCISIYTSLAPGDLLSEIHAIEKEMGRQRVEGRQYMDRTIDIDILFYGNREIDLEELVIPHPRVRERKFALIPLLEIYPDFIYPSTGEKLQDILDSCEDSLSVGKLP